MDDLEVVDAEHEPSVLEQLQLRLDGFVNLMTGLGSSLMDKTRATLFQRSCELQPRYLTDLFIGNWLARRACSVVPEEMLRPGYELNCGDVEMATAVRMALDELNACVRLKEAFVWENVHGGCAVLLGIDDGIEDQSLPVNEANIVELVALTVIERERCNAARYYEEGPKAGQPSHWYVTPVSGSKAGGQLLVHESRLLIFEGGMVTAEDRLQRNGWGQSVLQTTHNILADHDMSWAALAHMIQDANVGVWKIKNLLTALKSGGDVARQFFATRMRLTQSTMGVNRGIQLDADGEDYQRQPSQFTGVPESMHSLMLLVSGAFEMPVMVLFGQSPSGLSATGERDMQWFYDRTDVKRVERLKPKLERIVKLIFLSKEGPTRGIEPDEWDLKFPDLVRMTDLQQADLRNKQAQTDALEMQWGVITPALVRKSRHRPEGWTWRTQIEPEDEAELENAQGEELDDPNADPEKQGQEGEEAAPVNPNAVDPKGALQAGQITALLDVVNQVAEKKLPRAVGVAILVASFPIDEAAAERIMGPVGESFTREPEPPPAPFGGGPGGPGALPAQKPPTKPGVPAPKDSSDEEELRTDFDDDQPRDDSGQWSGSGSGGASRPSKAERREKLKASVKELRARSKETLKKGIEKLKAAKKEEHAEERKQLVQERKQGRADLERQRAEERERIPHEDRDNYDDETASELDGHDEDTRDELSTLAQNQREELADEIGALREEHAEELDEDVSALEEQADEEDGIESDDELDDAGKREALEALRAEREQAWKEADAERAHRKAERAEARKKDAAERRAFDVNAWLDRQAGK